MAVALAVLTVVPQSGATTAPPPRVTVIGDSILTAVLWNEQPLSILTHGLDMDLKIGICRRLTGVSCPFEGGEVPTLVDLVNELGSNLGHTVLVEVGYNDDPSTFAQSVEESITALLRAGARQIVWVNMREWQQQYIGMNQDLRAAARRHPELTIADWNAYSNSNYSWFQGDGTHLAYDGAIAMANLLHDELAEVVAPPQVIVPPRLPVARVGRPYATRLVAKGGIAPYHWQLTSGPLPRGLRLLADGHITGTPCRSADLWLIFRATDAFGHTAGVRTALDIERRVSPATVSIPCGGGRDRSAASP
jgi:hypothetical protein